MRESKVEENLENDENDSEHGNFAFRLQLDLRHPRPVSCALHLFHSSDWMICSSLCIARPDIQTVVFLIFDF